MTRNQRRKAARERLQAKQERFLARVAAARLEDVRNVVIENMGKPVERNFYPQSSMSEMQGQSHRGYICRASGGMPRGRAMALKASGKY